VARSNFEVARKQVDIGQQFQRRNYKTIEESDAKQSIIWSQSGAFVQKLHCGARKKFTGNDELIMTRSARTPYCFLKSAGTARMADGFRLLGNDRTKRSVSIRANPCPNLFIMI
jgi:hypothetical protein